MVNKDEYIFHVR